jgi:hypothetical protein
VTGFAIFCLGYCSGEGGIVVSGGRGFRQILLGRFEGLDCKARLQ